MTQNSHWAILIDFYMVVFRGTFTDDPLFGRTTPWNVAIAARPHGSRPLDDGFRPLRRVADFRTLVDVGSRRVIDAPRPPTRVADASLSPFLTREWINETATPKRNSWERFSVLITVLQYIVFLNLYFAYSRVHVTSIDEPIIGPFFRMLLRWSGICMLILPTIHVCVVTLRIFDRC